MKPCLMLLLPAMVPALLAGQVGSPTVSLISNTDTGRFLLKGGGALSATSEFYYGVLDREVFEAADISQQLDASWILANAFASYGSASFQPDGEIEVLNLPLSGGTPGETLFVLVDDAQSGSIGLFTSSNPLWRYPTAPGGANLVTALVNEALLGSLGTGEPVDLFLASPPSAITSQPQSAILVSGESVVLSVTATGATSYQWYRGISGNTSSPVEGATQATLEVSPTSTTQYWVRVENADGVATNSVAATLTVRYTLSVTAGSGGAVIIEPDQDDYADGETASLTALPDSGYVFDGWTGDAAGSENPLEITIGANTAISASFREALVPAILTPPQDATLTSGQSTKLSVSASNAVAYQWYRGPTGDTASPVSGAVSATLDVSPTTTASYWVRLTSADGVSTDSAAAVVTVVYTLNLSTNGNGSITADPDQTTYTSGANVSLSAVADSGFVFDQWTGDASGSTNPLFLTIDANTAIAAIFREAVAPIISAQPQPVDIIQGETANLSVSADQAEAFQWYTGASGDTSSPLSGQTSSSLAVSPAATTTYWARVTSADGVTSDSDAAKVTVRYTLTLTSGPNGAVASAPVASAYDGGTALTLTATPDAGYLFDQWTGDATGSENPLVVSIDRNLSIAGSFREPLVPSITSQPASVVVELSETAVLSVTAENAVAYQWYSGESGDTSSPVADATQATLEIAPDTTTSFWVRVTSSDTVTADSQAATVTVIIDPVVSIPDPNLEAAILLALDKPAGSAVTESEMASLTALIAEDAGIGDLTGLAFAKNLQALDVGRRGSSNSATDLGPLSGLTRLRELDVSGNEVADLTPLAGLTALEVLIAADNAIADLQPLVSLGALLYLDLEDNRLVDLAPLSGLTQLRQLYLNANDIGIIDALAGLTRLRDNFVFSGVGLELLYNRIDLGPGTQARSIVNTLGAIDGLTVRAIPQNPENFDLGAIFSRLARIKGGWWNSWWFGTFFIGDGRWIYHRIHGWMFIVGESEDDGLWFFNGDQGWLWARPGWRGWFYSLKRQGPVYFALGGEGRRWAYVPGRPGSPWEQAPRQD